MNMSEIPIHVVIGANYGDEGKGLVTNYLSHVLMSNVPEILESSHDFNILNVRYNGGAQAGHSVYQGNQKHVFGHFGAGSLIRNVNTYLTSDFIVNPFLFYKERESLLRHFSISPKVFVSDGAIITTPFDVMRNQVMEKLLALDNNHSSSVGVGIFQTILRNRDPRLSLTVGDFTQRANRSRMLRVLKAIADDTFSWYEDLITREVKNGFVPPSEWGATFTREKGKIFIENFLWCMDYFDRYTRSVIELWGDKEPMAIIFEGAQGLALSETNMQPSSFRITSTPLYALTPSRTGLDNIVAKLYGGHRSQLCSDTNDSGVHVHYVTRAYFTRHGKGPFPSEFPSRECLPLCWKIKDSTNAVHDYQGNLRLGLFDIDGIIDRIKEDIAKISSNHIEGIHLHVNFLDQTNDDLYVWNRIRASLKWVDALFTDDDHVQKTTVTEQSSEPVYDIIPHEKVESYLHKAFFDKGIRLTAVHFHNTADAEEGLL